ncbi:hypothetical protein [Sporolactobacillus laevolacticus]|uniref:Scaffolding protein n=1 Tax=Sporolactobacillus laevolacticus DSM 442 TaxID=1395513 RepID=V6IVK9_9BACL|nr:hypothetical protein [Sporolactobacillus laevolacticus]EST11263.1 hypothetical protein P343_12665 [Sporolactobacillus laevolacticus DSM 442]
MPKPYKLNLQYFAEGDPADPQPAQGGGDPQPSNSNKGGADPTPQPSADDIRSSILKELGVESLDSAKQSLADFKKFQDSQKTESQRLQDETAELKKQLEASKSAQTISDAKIAALGKGVRADAVDDVIKMVQGAEDIGAAIDSVLQKYPIFGAQQTPPAEPGHPRFVGQQQYDGDKTPDSLKQQFLKAFGIQQN